MKTYKYILALLLFVSCFSSLSAQNDGYVRDSFYKDNLKKALVQDTEKGTSSSMEELRKQLTNASIGFTLKENPQAPKLSPEEVYQKTRTAVLVLGKLYKKPNTEDWKLYQATAFVIDPDGLCVTNYHVFEEMWNGTVEEKGMGVMDIEGNYYPVTEVLCASKSDDIVVFRIDAEGKKLPYLSLGKEAAVGSDVFIVSHPAGNFYYFSSGKVTRKYWYPAQNSKRMSISASFALGSSGGPILDSQGQVIGMVAATVSLPSSRYVQMMVKEIIPVSAIRSLSKTVRKP